jgi:hypothetical protein
MQIAAVRPDAHISLRTSGEFQTFGYSEFGANEPLGG